jgi:predicted DsbA family dithiol-disulfide isomerase
MMIVEMSFTIEVFSDVVCPWCFVGKRRLAKAMKKLGWDDIPVHWKAFQLNPDMPRGGIERKEYRTKKFGSLEYAQQLDSHMMAVGAQENIEFHLDRIERAPNTFDAHRLIWIAGREGAQDKVVEALFRAYFTDGRDIGDPEILESIAQSCGLSPAFLETDLGKSEVLADRREAHERRISSVPSFLVNGVFATAGAQAPDQLAEFLKQARVGKVDIMSLDPRVT